jgi:hypothetical protein
MAASRRLALFAASIFSTIRRLCPAAEFRAAHALRSIRMLLDFEITSCSRQCAISGRTFAPGEPYFSTLSCDGAETVRRDYAADQWHAPPESVIAWWRSRMPEADGRPKLAPQDVLINLFIDLAEQPQEACFRYVLGLLLVRRRIMKLEETRTEIDGAVMVLDCPRRQEQYELRVAPPEAEDVETIQRRLVELLYGGA